MYKFTLVLIFNLIILNSIAQEREYSQFDIDTIVFLEVDLKETARFKNILLSNPSFHGWSKYYAYKSFAYMKIRESDSALKYANLAIETYSNREFEYKKFKTSVSKAYYIKGLEAMYNEKYFASLDYFYNSLKYAEGDTSIDAWNDYILQQIIGIHNRNENFEYSLKYSKKLLKSQNIIRHRYEYSKMFYDLGVLYSFLNIQDSSKYFFYKSKHAFYDLEKVYNENISEYANKSLINSIYNYLGEISYKEGDIDSAMFYLDKSKELYYEYLLDKDNLNIANNTAHLQSKINLGLLLYLDDNTLDARHHLESIFEEIFGLNKYSKIESQLISNFHEYLSLVYGDLVLVNEANNLYKDYNLYLLDYIEYNNFLQIQRLSTEFYVTEKEMEISALQTIKDNQETILKQRNIINWSLFILVLLVILIAFNINKKRKLKNEFKAVVLEQKLLRTQLNPHFIFNIISNIQNLGKNQNQHNILNDYLLDFSRLLRLSLRNSREEYVFLNDEIVAVKSYLKLSSKYSNEFNFNIEVDSLINLENTLIPPMFIQPLVENSIFHGLSNVSNGKINVKIIRYSDEIIKIIVLDNGVGYDANKNQGFNKSFYKSISGEVLKERLQIYSKILKKKFYLKISNREDIATGTKVELLLPFITENQ